MTCCSSFDQVWVTSHLGDTSQTITEVGGKEIANITLKLHICNPLSLFLHINTSLKKVSFF